MNETATPPVEQLMSPMKKLLWLLGLAAVIVGSISLGVWMSGGPRPVAPPNVLSFAFSIVLAVVFAFVGAVLFAIAVATCCFTFNLSKPAYRRYAVHRQLTNWFVPIFFYASFAVLCAPSIAMALYGRLSPTAVGMIAYFGPFVLAQLLGMWFEIWAGMDALFITRRLQQIGITREQISRGWKIGWSDATKKRTGAGGLVEDDFGALWIMPEALIVRGDHNSFDIPRKQILSLERKSHPRDASSFFGVRHILIHFIDAADGEERKHYLHMVGQWNATSYRRRMDQLADAIEQWRTGAASPEPKEQMASAPLQ